MKLSKLRLAALKSAYEVRTGKSWAELISRSTEVVLFGSWAVHGETAVSDIDLLCVDFPSRIKSGMVDVIGYPSEFINSDSWLTSELAVHIARYGIWVKGTGKWRRKAHITAATVAKKREQIAVRAVRLVGGEATATTRHRSRELLKLRRDLQRLVYLSGDKATPPAALLDHEWNTRMPARTECARLLSTVLNDFTSAVRSIAAHLS